MKLLLLFSLFSLTFWSFNSVEKTKSTVEFIEKADSTYPVPVVVLSNGKSTGLVGSGEMKAQKALFVTEQNSNNPAALKDICSITNFSVMVVRKSNKYDPVMYTNNGNIFDQTTIDLLNTVSSGDTVSFISINGRCTGDAADRTFNNLSFPIK